MKMNDIGKLIEQFNVLVKIVNAAAKKHGEAVNEVIALGGLARANSAEIIAALRAVEVLSTIREEMPAVLSLAEWAEKNPCKKSTANCAHLVRKLSALTAQQTPKGAGQ